MKKYFSYILILIALTIGLSVPIFSVNAQYAGAGVCWKSGLVVDGTLAQPMNSVSDCNRVGGTWQAPGTSVPLPPNGPAAPTTPAPTEPPNPPMGGACRWHLDRFHSEGEIDTSNPPLTKEQCDLNSPHTYWDPSATPAPKPPAPLPGTPIPIPSAPPLTPYQLLAPLPCESGPGCVEKQLTTFDTTGKGGGALGGYLNLMIKLFIGICAVLAVIMIVIGGIQYMTTELISSKEEGKKRILGAIFGLLLALGAYTLLYTINPNLLKSDLSKLIDVTVEVDLNDNIAQTYDPVTKKYRNGAVFGASWDATRGEFADLAASGATIYNSQCTTIGQQNCTSTRGLDPSVLNTIHQQCPDCTLIITGGTEFWAHGGTTGSTNHQVGNTTIDLRLNPALDAYLSGGKPLVKMQRYQSPVGSVLYEGNHWHIGP
ncbi:TPA: hypothetical protein DEQ22_03165 [Candidatus Nomurabacteria bacterium]|uniref:Uncharacterized protein n=2 Tax=Candidatus Nomuraibacteriota TaxID=1752729 RepID=A0A1F6YPU7_9BACT|nr:MAG: hypothetical protein UV13_C0006G0043 [Parcubacteria group bacterium GW2011_GWC1_42_21]KKS58404.1 MAG: hypothetical protein UV23_C0008G0019 [Candidatus Nomurabacteria bacterium GW2011_GWF1_42_40]KKT00306.1 MAG: hypothetical protein UV77_C0005G0043 [Candidatus Nomurabacteria bacterium GW2011_GWA1_43_17]KKT08110.1 MAG: hypothetical protein UV85_C0001G0043 [Candidatus Nomurabacteria bacterium GW2011_GWB1_43_19]KKT11495.1 MAG: hypothetical protein UV91_C0005G0043 [Candidatus Nomurabacteria b